MRNKDWVVFWDTDILHYKLRANSNPNVNPKRLQGTCIDVHLQKNLQLFYHTATHIFLLEMGYL